MAPNVRAMKPSILLPTPQLEQSPVVANNRMNRQRVLFGINSYQKELGIDFLKFLQAQALKHPSVHWMDLCCGTGNALIQAAETLRAHPAGAKIILEGLDLVGMFSPVPQKVTKMLSLQIGSVFEWTPQVAYDLITCIHGVHYLGDKLGFLQKVLALLKPDGKLVINLDPNNLKDANGAPLVKWWKATCKTNGWHYNPRRHLLQIDGRQMFTGNWTYLGADDQAGPNYSGQPVVDSYYELH
jgi:SAM-dependent methyltransferase